MRSELKKYQGSGTGFENYSQEEYIFYQNMQFLEPHTKPREILSSRNIAAAVEVRPESELFFKKKRAQKNEIEDEFAKANKLFAIAVDHLTKPEKKVPIQEEAVHKKDEYCQAVLKTFDSLDEADKLEGLILALQWIMVQGLEAESGKKINNL